MAEKYRIVEYADGTFEAQVLAYHGVTSAFGGEDIWAPIGLKRQSTLKQAKAVIEDYSESNEIKKIHKV